MHGHVHACCMHGDGHTYRHVFSVRVPIGPYTVAHSKQCCMDHASEQMRSEQGWCRRTTLGVGSSYLFGACTDGNGFELGDGGGHCYEGGLGMDGVVAPVVGAFLIENPRPLQGFSASENGKDGEGERKRERERERKGIESQRNGDGDYRPSHPALLVRLPFRRHSQAMLTGSSLQRHRRCCFCCCCCCWRSTQEHRKCFEAPWLLYVYKTPYMYTYRGSIQLPYMLPV
jgi:hypothetical protein